MFDWVGYVSSWNVGVEWFKGYVVDEIMGEYFFCFYIDEDWEVGIFWIVLRIV